ncbi:hypothetical protein O3G_MSEX002370 [Manduca sexta]|uniref:NADH-ubiquinone oxidoreductase 9 kDa subunit n=1 Tax=Manduca sexta TaxID=7130 RepID=A0A922CE12_MANSE|nr:hypothetical protein O3G_MSEX002370 [Manduca sexta]
MMNYSRLAIRNNTFRLLVRYYSETSGSSQGTSAPAQPPPPASSAPGIPDVPGLSSAVVHPASQPVGPGVDPSKSGAYKVPEYFCYDNTSFFEAEIEMAKYRLPQPSALKK